MPKSKCNHKYELLRVILHKNGAFGIDYKCTECGSKRRQGATCPVDLVFGKNYEGEIKPITYKEYYINEHGRDSWERSVKGMDDNAKELFGA